MTTPKMQWVQFVGAKYPVKLDGKNEVGSFWTDDTELGDRVATIVENHADLVMALQEVLERADKEYLDLTDCQYGSFSELPEGEFARRVLERFGIKWKQDTDANQS